MSLAGQSTPPVPWDEATVPSDPRLAAFARLVNAIDATDAREGIAATRELRRLGFSVVMIGPKPSRGPGHVA